MKGKNTSLVESDVNWIGEIPEQWDTVCIRYVARLETGHTPSRSEQEYWEGGEIPWFSLSDMSRVRQNGSPYVYDTNEKITQAGLENASTRLLPKGTVILSRTATIGFTCILGVDAATDQSMVNWVCGDEILPEYLYYVFNAMDDELERLSQGSTHQTIYMPDVRLLETPLPPISEQKEIVSLLNSKMGNIEKLINDKNKLISKVDNKLKSEIESAITTGVGSTQDTIDSGFEWFGEIPENWELLPLKRLTKKHSRIAYGIVQPGPNQEEGIPYIKGGECVPEKLDPEHLSKTTPEIAKKYERSRLLEGDLVYEIRGSVGRVVKVPPELEGANLTQDTARISPHEDINSDWLLYALRSEPFYQQMDVNSRGATVEGVNLFDLRRGIVPVPPRNEQDAIVSYISKFDSKVNKTKEMLDESIEVLESVRESLIKNIVTGKVPVDEIENGE